MHIDRNHSWLPAGTEAALVEPGSRSSTCATSGSTDNPTRPGVRCATRPKCAGVGCRWSCPTRTPALYSGRATGGSGRRGSLSALPVQRVSTGPPRSPGGAPPASFPGLAFKRAGQDWIGYDQAQSNSSGSGVDAQFAEHSTPTGAGALRVPYCPAIRSGIEALLPGVVAIRYPGLDLEPWRCALADREGSG